MRKLIELLNTCLWLCWLSTDSVAGFLSRNNQQPVNEQPYQINLVEEWNLEPWLSDDIKLGQVSGVSIDPDEKIYLFHRADRVWDDKTFTIDNVYTGQHLGPITQPTILIFDQKGTLINQLGQNMFFMPHGITVDSEFNIWVTDVALHQVMKISPSSNSTSLVLGEKFVPGKGLKHFCKPTSVAVVSNGDFFVADGYCNSRILKYNSKGVKILEWGRHNSNPYRPTDFYDLNIPHALALAEDKRAICVADRENGRVVCYKIDSGQNITQFASPLIGRRIFSVAYSSTSGGRFFIVNGKSEDLTVPVQGVVLNPYGNIVGKFGNNLNAPHDLAVTADGNTVYVVEIGPFKAWKYVKKNCNPPQEEILSEQTQSNIYQKRAENVEGLTGAVLVTISCFVFAAGLFIAVLIYSKSRKSGSADTRRLLSNIDY